MTKVGGFCCQAPAGLRSVGSLLSFIQTSQLTLHSCVPLRQLHPALEPAILSIGVRNEAVDMNSSSVCEDSIIHRDVIA
jgi:hypothetical protein